MRTTTLFNDHWLFCPDCLDFDTPDDSFERVTLPHTNMLLPHHYFDNAAYQFVSTYRKRFTLPEPRGDRRVYLDFDGAMIACEVFLNGAKLGEHRGGFTPFSFELTEHLRDENVVTVYLDSTERKDIPPYGHVVDYLTFGGMYRDVRLRVVESCHLTNVFVHAQDVLSPSPTLIVEAGLRNQNAQPETVALRVALKDAQGHVVATGLVPDVTVPAQGDVQHTITLPNLPEIQLWSPDNPTLYFVEVSLSQHEQLLDAQTARFGFREAAFRQDGGFYLNGQRLNLIGLNRHQTYPYIGAAAPARLQRRDVDIIKHELACNIVRTSHYPQSPHFLDRCDEIGLLVFEEIPGWQHVGDEAWQALSLRDVRAMIERDRNHPAIVLWGVRINESRDDEAFYTATNALAHQLDPTRQTGGVRNFRNSQFLEDVYTFNDFSNSIVEPDHTPHLVTEFSGHMFPTKSWDQEGRLVEHALRHARIQDRQLGMDRVAGAIGWCAFDYNTHQEFGSGDHICYHGVMDIFRMPKYAANFYASQHDPQQRIVLHAATIWSMGDNDTSGIDPLVIFSNCEEVEVLIGESSLGRYQPDRDGFPHLPHPPYRISLGTGNLTWGKALADLTVLGYLDGQVVAEQRIAANGLPAALLLKLDDDQLHADGVDMTRLAFRIVDAYGNRLPFANQVVSFEVEGPADLIGENPFALMGGQAAVFIRARQQAGLVTVRARTPQLPCVSVTLAVGDVL